MDFAKFENPARVGILLALATIAVYLRALGLDFINFDDPDYVTGNSAVLAGLTWWGAGWAFAQPYASNWHPLTWLSHMLDCQLFALNPAGHHLTNVAFHTANTVLLFLLLRRMTRACWRSALVAALFALHPLHVESVAWVSERKDVLSAFFGLLSLWCYAAYIDHRQRFTLRTVQWYLLALFLFGLGLMSKPVLVTWPCVMLLLDYWPLRRFEPAKSNPSERLRRLVVEKIPFFILSVVSCVITLSVQNAGGSVARLVQVPLDLRITNALASYLRYIAKLVWPAHLTIMYRLTPAWPLIAVLLGALALAAVSLLVLRQRRSKPYLLVGWAWYLGTLVPMIGLVQVGNQSMADRYTYLPAIGLFLILAWGAADLIRGSLSRRVVMAVAGLSLGACAVTTYFQLLNWRNSETLFRHAIAVDPQNFVAHDCLGMALADKGELEAAEKFYRTALALNPAYWAAWNNLGCALRDQHKHQEAITTLEVALRLNPKLAVAHNNLGAAFFNANRPDEAIAQYCEALKIDPVYFEARFNLANALASQQQLGPAELQYRQVLRSSPRSAAARYKLAVVLAQQDKFEQAEQEFRTTLALQPALRQAHQGLGEALAQQGKTEQAAREFLAAAQACLATGHLQEGVAALTKARDLALTAGQKELAKTAEQQLIKYRSQETRP